MIINNQNKWVFFKKKYRNVLRKAEGQIIDSCRRSWRLGAEVEILFQRAPSCALYTTEYFYCTTIKT